MSFNKFDQALEDFDHGIAIYPGTSKIRADRALVLKKLGRMEEAMREAESVRNLEPGYDLSEFE